MITFHLIFLRKYSLEAPRGEPSQTASNRYKIYNFPGSVSYIISSFSTYMSSFSFLNPMYSCTESHILLKDIFTSATLPSFSLSLISPCVQHKKLSAVLDYALSFMLHIQQIRIIIVNMYLGYIHLSLTTFSITTFNPSYYLFFQAMALDVKMVCFTFVTLQSRVILFKTD